MLSGCWQANMSTYLPAPPLPSRLSHLVLEFYFKVFPLYKIFFPYLSRTFESGWTMTSYFTENAWKIQHIQFNLKKQFGEISKMLHKCILGRMAVADALSTPTSPCKNKSWKDGHQRPSHSFMIVKVRWYNGGFTRKIGNVNNTYPLMTANSGSQILPAETTISDKLLYFCGSQVSRSSVHSCNMFTWKTLNYMYISPFQWQFANTLFCHQSEAFWRLSLETANPSQFFRKSHEIKWNKKDKPM